MNERANDRWKLKGDVESCRKEGDGGTGPRVGGKEGEKREELLAAAEIDRTGAA